MELSAYSWLFWFYILFLLQTLYKKIEWLSWHCWVTVGCETSHLFVIFPADRWVRNRTYSQGNRMIDGPVDRQALPPYHPQVVHQAGAMLPDFGGLAGELRCTHILAAVELLDSRHHCVDCIVHQAQTTAVVWGWREGIINQCLPWNATG